MTRRRTKPSKPAAKPAAKAPQMAAPLSPLVLARATEGSLQHTSLAQAQRVPIDRSHYTARETAAAGAVHAMDYAGLNRNAQDALSFVEATGWPGFQNLALLAQLPEYRTMHETLADEVVRTWGHITSTSDDGDVPGKIQKLMHALDRYKVRSLVRQAVVHDQAFGGAHIFPRLRDASADVPPDAPLLLSPAFVRKGCLDSFSTIEPVWVTPNAYNASDPTKANFFKPESWYMLSTVVHATRLHTMISRPVSDMLKAAYSFRGVSISQLAMPYVDNWLRTRQSVSDTVKQFSITYLKTDLGQMLAPGGAQSLFDRAQLFNLMRDNRNLGLCDMTGEDFAQLNTPLSGLDALQAQSQEQMAAVAHVPLVKLLGITPSGLNASSDGEIRVWYDFVAGYQSHNATPLMHWILQLIQLSEFGEIDPGLSWDWNPLYELTDLELADMRSKNADTDTKYLDAQIISGEMVQQRLQQDPNSGYSGILADRDELDEVRELAQSMLTAPEAPENEEPTNEQDDADQSDEAGKADSADRGRDDS